MSRTTQSKTIRRFKVIRPIDITGISGTGHVIDGVVFDDGTTVIKWLTNYSSISIFKTFKDFKHIHIDVHPENKSEIIFLDD